MIADILLHLLAGLIYLGIGLSLWLPLYKQQLVMPATGWRRYLLLLAITIHGVAIHIAMLHHEYIQLSWSAGLSLTMWIVMLIFWLERLLGKIDGFLLFLLPFSTLATLLAAIFPSASHQQLIIPINSEPFRLHIILSIVAYSIIAITAIQSGLMALFDRYLHRTRINERQGLAGLVVKSQPPLMVQERILFLLVWVGFGVFSLAILSGAYISWHYKHMIFPLDHKTIFSLLSWLIFAVLLLGRWLWGWRGRRALRCNMIGFTLLLLGYTGTRFVLDVLLK